MSTMVATGGRAPTGARAASRAALDVLLTDAAIEPRTVGRLVQPATAARLPAALPATRAASRGASAASAPSSRGSRSAARGRPAQGRPPLRRPGVAGELAVPPADAGLSRARRCRRGLVEDAGLDWRDRAARPVHGRQPARRGRADEPRLHQPRGAQGDDRPRRRQPRHGRPPVHPRCLQRPAARDGRHDAGSRSVATSRSARARSCCARRCSS